MCPYCQPLIKAIDRYIEKADDDLSDALEEEGFVDPEETVKRSSKLEDKLSKALLAESALFAAAIAEEKSLAAFAKRWPTLKAADKTAADIAREAREAFQDLVPRLADKYIQSYDKGLRITSISKRTTAWIESWSRELGNLMQTTSQDELEVILIQGLEDGIGIAEFTRRIQESGIRDEYYRARTTALTEVLRAHSVAQQEAFMQDPAVNRKSWKHSGAYRIAPRDNHVAMDGQIVPKGDPFTLLGADGETYYPLYPRDPDLPPGESINCHCIAQPIVDEAIIGMSLDERKALQQQAIEEMDDEWEKELNERNKWRGVPEEDRRE